MHKRISSIVVWGVLILILMGLTSSLALAADKFYSEHGRFKVAFKGEPRDFNMTQDSEFGSMVWYGYGYQAFEYLALILYCDLPENMLKGIDSPALLDGVGNAMLTDGKDVLMSKKTLFVSGYPGIEIVFTTGEKFNKRVLLMAGHRIYVCGVETTKDYIDSPVIENFFNSFELMSEKQ